MFNSSTEENSMEMEVDDSEVEDDNSKDNDVLIMLED